MGLDFTRHGAYRYALMRHWGAGKRCVLFIGLNPSTADARHDDPTVRRMMSFARNWGYDSLWVANIFALRSTDPKGLQLHAHPVGPQNDAWILGMVRHADCVVAAWGDGGRLHGRAAQVAALLGRDARCLGVTVLGEPRHPLYVPASRTLSRLP